MRDFRTQYDVFQRLCVAGTELSDSRTAFSEVDRVLAMCARYKRPVYLDIPRDMVDVVPDQPHMYRRDWLKSDHNALTEASQEAARLLTEARKPVIVAGVEVHRFGLQDELLALAEGSSIPIATTILGKSVIRETHPLFVGLYEGAMGREEVTEFVKASDCILLLGTFMSDLNLGIFTASLDAAKCIYATSEELRIRHHHYHDVLLNDFIRELASLSPETAKRSIPTELSARREPFELQPEAPVTTRRLVAMLNERLEDDMIVVADIGDSLFAASELVIDGRAEFLSPAYYTSMGYAVPASLGVHVAAPNRRVVAIVGDGAFQMTGMELSNLVRHGYDPIIFVLDNGGYGTERFLHPGEWPYNEIHGWNYDKLPEVLGGGKGYRVRTEQELADAVEMAWNDSEGLSLVHIELDRADHSRTLGRMAERLRDRV